jgi:MFS family permease
VPFSIFKDRNFSAMNFLAAPIGFGMLGLFLPLTIYLQSVLGFTALRAGLTTAPMSLISMFVAPVAGRFADRVGGKWILFVGVSLFAGGMGILIDSAHVGSSQWHLLPGLIVAGFGLGMTFAPLQTIAMRDIQPQMAGAASGLINTTRQLGSVIGSAAVGALLSSQLTAELSTSATKHSQALPPQFQQQFVQGFKSAAASGADLEVTGKPALHLPAGIPGDVATTIGKIAKATFDEGFTNAMRTSLILPIAMMGVAALSVLLVKHRRATATDAPAAPAAETVTETPVGQ